MQKYDVIVIGGGPAGVISAVTAKKCDRVGSVLLLRTVKTSLIPCGIPYIFSTLDSVEKDIMGDKSLINNGIDIAIDTVTDVVPASKTIKTAGGKEYQYEKLVLATGSSPVKLPIEGIDLPGIYLIKKDMDYLKKLREDVLKAKNIVIIGGGFIGVEFSDDISKLPGKKITIVEMLPHVVNQAFDDEFALKAEEELKKKGVDILTNSKVVKFDGSGKVEKVVLDGGREIPADVVIVSIGAKPNVELAKKAGLDISKSGGIWVDEYMRTSNRDIFAVGDCAEKRDFYTRERVPVMLASTATAEARIAGVNLFKIQVIRENKGTIAIFSTKVGDVALAAAGLTEKRAIEQGYEIVTGEAEAANRHPGNLPGAMPTKVKLVFSKRSGILLGGQVAGGAEVGELINVIGLAIQQGIPGCELFTLQVGTHPMLTAAPTIYPFIVASQNAMAKVK